MKRLQERYRDSDSLVVLVNNTTELLLLLDNRHVKYEKENLAHLDGFFLETDRDDLGPVDVAKIVSKVYPGLFSEDIAFVTLKNERYTIEIKPNTLIHYGTFHINKRKSK